jgi:hypothetical protein
VTPGGGNDDAPMSADRLFPLASVLAWLMPALLLILRAA